MKKCTLRNVMMNSIFITSRRLKISVRREVTVSTKSSYSFKLQSYFVCLIFQFLGLARIAAASSSDKLISLCIYSMGSGFDGQGSSRAAREVNKQHNKKKINAFHIISSLNESELFIFDYFNYFTLVPIAYHRTRQWF